jgi:hypothetical protein
MRSAPNTCRLSLALHVRACACDGQVILLDLRRSRYLGLGSVASQVLGDCVDGWPLGRTNSDGSAFPASVSGLTQQLLSQGLLTQTPTSRPIDADFDEALASLDFEDISAAVRISARRTSRFLRCSAIVALRLRLQTLQSIAGSIADRKARCGRHASELDVLKESAIAYEKLRPFVFSARSKCLFDSLAMVDFLAAEGLFPSWVIGVKTGPFGAHAWVQSGSTVLNDQHENVRRFRPILIV